MPELHAPVHLLPFVPASLVMLGGGRNSRVFKASAADGQTCVLKEYFTSPCDNRQRLHTEWTALTFLHGHGLHCIPRPLFCHEGENVAVYEYIEGDRPEPSQAVEDVFPWGDFWQRLYALRGAGLSAALPPASDACFSLKEAAQHVLCRCQRLLHTPQTTTARREMHAFVRAKLLPLLQHSLHKAEAALPAAHLRADFVLPASWRMPSPSDFGWHNAVQRADGQLCFVDFEYFGMDDPVKLLADTCLHPGMMLSTGQKYWLVQRMQRLAQGGGDMHFGVRFACLLPIWRCTWCCIVLNAFVPHDDARRAFAQGGQGDEELLYQQLAKAQRLADTECHEYERFFSTRA